MNEPSKSRADRLQNIPRWVGIGLFLYASVFALSQAEAFFVPVVLGFLLSMVLAPVRRRLDRLGVNGWLSSFLIVSVLLCLLGGLLTALSMPVSKWVDNAPRIERQVEHKFATLSKPLNQVLQVNDKLSSIGQTKDQDSHSPEARPVHVSQGESMTTQAALLAPTMLAQFLFTLVLLFFLLASGDMFYEKLVHVMPTFRDKRRATRIVYNAERKLSRYLSTITVINLGLGVVVGAAMALLGMPDPIVFGTAAFLLNFVPYLGALAGIIVAGAIALVSFDWLGWPFIVMGIYLALTTLEGQIITPYFVGRSLRLNTVVVFLAVSFWAWLWSAVGMIVALPLLIALRTVCEHIEELDHISAFLSERHAEELSDPT